MKKLSALLAVLMTSPLTLADAAMQSYPVKIRQLILEDRGPRHEWQKVPHPFRVELISDEQGLLPEEWRRGKAFVTASPQERYAIRVYNPMPVRVAVNLTVDGLNTISGKPSGISDGNKWIIDPYGFITIRGWQVNSGEARRFFFTDKPKSYAKWRGERMDLDLVKNCGVIGAAFFWSQAELDAYYDNRPIYRYSQAPMTRDNHVYGGFSAKRMAKPQAAMEQQDAGTGMGEREHHPTVQVAFHFDRGMYKASQAIAIFYDFAAKTPEPEPFPALSYAPEM